jgi:hypothetical protein
MYTENNIVLNLTVTDYKVQRILFSGCFLLLTTVSVLKLRNIKFKEISMIIFYQNIIKLNGAFVTSVANLLKAGKMHTVDIHTCNRTNSKWTLKSLTLSITAVSIHMI